jgi:16S rRNA (uracil1498-N3)-methyltransferase
MLDGAEAHHALHVVRVRTGDAVTCFDGLGTEISGRVVNADRSSLTIDPEQVTHHPKPDIQLTLAQAWLHRDKAIEELVKRATELGVTAFIFFKGDHSERAPKPSDKWARWAIDSCKQCGRSWLPTFAIVDDIAAVVDGSAIIATQHQTQVPLHEAVSAETSTLIVGPEGDFSDKELAVAESCNAKAVSLGDATYRSEVAATLLAALVLYEKGGVGPR